jgi:tRNA(Ile)-lysidine synthase
LVVVAALVQQAGLVGDVVVLHVDHLTRPESGLEGEFVAGLADSLGLPVERLTIAPGDPGGSSPEAWLRERRYDALDAACHRLGLTAVVTAHTLDDQIETVLMRLFTGASGLALTGMRETSSRQTSAGVLTIQRPWLGISRREIEAIPGLFGVKPVHDPTNTDPTFRRNAVRHDLVPRLAEIFPGFEQPLLRAVELASRDARTVDALAEEAWGRAVVIDGDRVRVERAFVRREPASVVSRVLRRAVLHLSDADDRDVTFERVEAVRRAAHGRSGAQIELPGGVVARIDRDAIVLLQRGVR